MYNDLVNQTGADLINIRSQLNRILEGIKTGADVEKIWADSTSSSSSNHGIDATALYWDSSVAGTKQSIYEYVNALSATLTADLNDTDASEISFNPSALPSTWSTYIDVQAALQETISVVDTLSAGASQWTDGGAFLYPKGSNGIRNIIIGNTASATADIVLNADGSAIFNEQGAAVDFRIEGDTETNLFFVDGSADSIGIGTSTPQGGLDLSTSPLYLSEISAPGNPSANTGVVYVKDVSAVTSLFFKDSAGTEINLLEGGASIVSATTAPGSPDPGDLWYDTTNNILNNRVLDAASNAAWIDISTSGGGGVSAWTGLSDTPASLASQGGKVVTVNSGGTALELATPSGGITVTSQDAAPSSPSIGDIWYDTDDNILYIRVNDGTPTAIWLDISTAGGGSGGWAVAGSVVNTIDSTDDVGIGTSTPAAKLHVEDTAGTGSTAKEIFRLNMTGSGAQAPYMTMGSNGTAGFKLSHTNSFARLKINHSYSQATELHLGLRGTDLFALYHTTGNVTISGTLTENSDERTKENIVDLDKGVDFINSLRPVSYTRKNVGDERTHYGLIAQEVEPLVGTDALVTHKVEEEDGEDPAVDSYGLAYSQLVAPLIKSVQELSARVVELEAKLGE